MNSPLFLRRRGFLGALFAFFFVAPSPAIAQSLNDARDRGLVVETASGYIEARSDDPAIRNLVQSVNQRRAAHYQEIAQRNDVSVSVVEAQAGQELMAAHPPR